MFAPSQLAFLALLGALVLERLVELRVSRRNARALAARGGVEAGRGHFPVMAILHGSFLVAAAFEVIFMASPWHPRLAIVCLFLAAGAQALRWWVVATLGERWTVRVFVVPGEGPVSDGPYRFLRHPNYLAVIVELAAVPLIHGAWRTALFYSLANALLLAWRIRVEERALAEAAPYHDRMPPRAIVPGPPRG